MTLPDFFDVNGPGSDSHLQFMNWTVDNNGAWDYAADTRGYTVGGMAEYDDRAWSLRYGLFAMPIVANGIDMDWAFSRAHGQNGEFELRHSFVRRSQGRDAPSVLCQPRPHGHLSRGGRGLSQRLRHGDLWRHRPDITLHEHFGALKYGFGYNTEQELTENLRVFGRFGWNEGQHESFAYTEVDQTVEVGARLRRRSLASPGRQDRPGRCLERDQARPPGLSAPRRPGLPARRRQPELRPREHRRSPITTGTPGAGLFYSLDVQHIDNPGYNRDRGPAWVGSVRAHVDF